MNTVVKEKLRRRVDYTHKFNTQMGRHGWLRLTPAYSVKIVEEIMGQHQKPLQVLDPFCGTATTALSAAYHGHKGVTMDINPFLVWFGQTKTAQYSEGSIASARKACARAIDAVKRRATQSVKAPPIHNIGRWWSPEALNFLCALRAGIEAETKKDSAARSLLLVAFCRTLIKLSNAAFNHQSLSFKDDQQLHIPLDISKEQMFMEDACFVLEGAAENPEGSGHVLFGDSRNLPHAVNGSFDLIVTSPPYANRMSYIRELRPYMYWLGFLNNGREAGEMDWAAIGGTWGIATSRLINWKRPAEPFTHPFLDRALDKITHHNNKNGHILANYVTKYFDDMWQHFNSLTSVLNKGGQVHYIVGNSTFYGALLAVEKIYAAMLELLGFEEIECRAIRKRNSKKELIEFDVAARWTGQKH